MSLTDIDQVPRVYGVPTIRHASLTEFAEGKVRRSPQLSKQETRRTYEQVSASLISEKPVKQINPGLSKVQKTLRWNQDVEKWC